MWKRSSGILASWPADFVYPAERIRLASVLDPCEFGVQAPGYRTRLAVADQPSRRSAADRADRRDHCRRAAREHLGKLTVSAAFLPLRDADRLLGRCDAQRSEEHTSELQSLR